MSKKVYVLIRKEHHSTTSGLQRAKTNKVIKRVIREDNEGLYIRWRGLRFPVEAWRNGDYITTGSGIGY